MRFAHLPRHPALRGGTTSADAGRSVSSCIGAACLLAAAVLLPATAARAQVRGNPVDTLPVLPDPESEKPQASSKIKQPRNSLDSLMAVQLTPHRFAIEGVHSIPFDEVAQRFAAFAGKTVTVGELVKVAESVTAQYQAAGYALSFAYLPAQSFDNGVVRVIAVEGYVDSIKIEGDLGNMEDKVRAIAAHMSAERPLKKATFERYVNLMGLLPGLQVAVTLPPPQSTSGAAELKIKATRKRIALESGADFNHPGIQLLTSATLNGVTSLGDQLTVSTILLPGRYPTDYYAAGYSVPLGSDGLVAKLDGYHYHARADDVITGPTAWKHDTDTQRLTLALSYPLVLSNTTRTNISGGLYANDFVDHYEARGPGNVVSVENRVRAVFAEITYNDNQPKRSRSAGLAIYRGINDLGAGLVNSSADLDFTRVRGRVQQSDEWREHLVTTLAATAQYSPDNLPVAEQISFGGLQFGRGYPAGEIAGDSGWGASAEVARAWPVAFEYLKSIAPYVMVDMAQAYRNAFALRHGKLASFAIGARLSDGKRNSIDLSLAVPIGEKPAGHDNRPLRANLLYGLHF